MFQEPSGLKYEEKDLSPQHPIHYHCRYFSEDSTIRLHYHDSPEINLILGAEGAVLIEGESHSLAELSLLVLPPRCLHGYRLRGRVGSRIRVWHLGLESLELLNGAVMERIFDRLPGALLLPEIDSEMQEILDELESGTLIGKSAAVLHLLSQLTVLLGAEPRIGGRDDFLHRVIAYLEEHFREDVSLEDAANRVHLSRSHFCRKFKERSGSSFSAFLGNIRLEQSLRLLDRGESVERAALESGYSDSSYFIKRFKAFYGITPGAYLKHLRRG